MRFTNRQFGELEYEGTHVFHFPEGIIGFEHLRNFLLIDDADSQPFRWLVSLDDSDLSFPLIPPSIVVQNYQVGFSTDTTVFAVALLTEPLEDSTVNLRAPITIDNATRRGRQVVLDREEYAIQHPLFDTPVTVQGE